MLFMILSTNKYVSLFKLFSWMNITNFVDERVFLTVESELNSSCEATRG